MADHSDSIQSVLHQSLSTWQSGIAGVLQEAIDRGDLAKSNKPQELASFLLNSYGSQTFVSFVNPTTGNGPSFNVGMGTTILGGQYLDLGLSNITAGCDNSGAWDPNKILDTTTVIPALNTWYNAIYAYHKGTIRVYVNGALVSTKQSAGPTAQLCPSSQLIVGAWWNSDKQGINGKLDNVRLYNRTLTAKEITTLSQSYLVVGTSVRPGVRTN